MYRYDFNFSSCGTASTSTSGIKTRDIMDAIGRLTKTIYVPTVRREEYDFSFLLRDPEKESPLFVKSDLLFGEQAYVIAGIGVVASPSAFEYMKENNIKVKWSLERINLQKWIYENKDHSNYTSPSWLHPPTE